MVDPERAGSGSTPPAPRLSIVLGTLNERANLPELFGRLRQVPLPSWEAIIVDDGSTDGSRPYLEELTTSDPRFRAIFHDGQQTTVRAQCQGIQAARGTFVSILDADLQHPPELLPRLVRSLEEGASLTVASRYTPGGSAGERSAFRGLLSRLADLLARLLLTDARRISDPVSGFFAFRREVYVPLDPGYRGYKLLLFLLVMAHDRSVAEIPFRFEPRTAGASKVVGGLGFVRVFLTEVILAKRLERGLRAQRRGRGAPRIADG
ncbi:MAG: glycosyltransferase [Thermoplasmata archaeon]